MQVYDEMELRNFNVLDITHVNHNDNGESLLHTDKKKCLYCDYEEQPFFLRIHIRNSPREQAN